MVSVTTDSQYISPVPPARLFKALILDDQFIAKVMPQGIKSVQLLEGDGGVGSIKMVTFGEGSQLKSVKQRVDKIDKETFTYGYTVIEIEGGSLKDVIESITNVVKLEPSNDGGSICKTSSTYLTKGDAQLTEEEIKLGKERVSFMFKNLEAFLLANPDAYN